MHDNTLWLIPGLPLLGSLLCAVMYAITLRQRKDSPGTVGLGPLAGWTAVAMMAVAFVLGLTGFFTLQGDHSITEIASSSWDWIHVSDALNVDVAMVLDRLSGAMTLVVTGVGLLIHIYAVGYMKGDPGFAKFFAYLNLFVAMMLVLILSSSIVGTFVGWEGVGLCSYLLIGFWYRKGWPAEAAQKAFVVNRIGDAAFLIGMFLLVHVLGSFDYATINEKIVLQDFDAGSVGLLALAALLLFGGACGKSAQIPLFVWLPDAMAGPTPVSALIHAATMVTSGVYLVIRLNPLYASAPAVMMTIAIVGALTAFIAGSSALRQRDLKGVLAYSTVSQLGYMFLALGVGAWSTALFHVITHAFFKALLFLAAGSVIHGMHDEKDMHKMGGLRKYMPKTFLTFTAGAAALSGLPLLSGFFSKDEILAMTFQHGGVYLLLWGIGIATAGMTAYYSWRMVALTFFGSERFDAGHVQPHESPRLMTMPLFILAALAVGAGVLNLPPVMPYFGQLTHWLQPVTAAGDAILGAGHHMSHTTEWLLLGLGSVIALAGAHFGFHHHRKGPGADHAFEAKHPQLAAALGDAWGIDRTYKLWIVQPIMLGARMIAVVIDQVIIDGAVNGLGRLAQSAGHRVRRTADGSLSTYGLWMGGAACTLVVLWMWIGN
jgi:NADH-quinone oxidoreductase subunit L